MLQQTEIFTLNLASAEIENIKKSGIEIYEGSIGYLTSLSYGYLTTLNCLPNFDLPTNFHEYGVGIIDMTNERKLEYCSEEHTHKNRKTSEHSYLYCMHPQDLFDPRPFSLYIAREKIAENLQKGFLLIIFCSANETIKYSLDNGKIFEAKYLDFLPLTPYNENRIGKRTKIPREEGEVSNFFKKYNNQFHYELMFDHPGRTINGEYVDDTSYMPLVLSADDKIVGMSWRDERSGVFFLPKLDNKGPFLKEFLTEIAPTLFPHLFPDIVKDRWLNEERYQLPNQSRLVSEKEELTKKFNEALVLNNQEIKRNKEQFGFLSQMITKSGDELVFSVIQFLKWLGFEKAVDADLSRKSTLKEEDIYIETEKGLIVIEVKGIGGMPADSDCSQIGKVRTRRQKERNSFDVFALFIVNHERHKPAATRINPPFSPEQLKDAEYDSRALITTWQLFNVFNAIEAGVLNKESVRSNFYKSGNIDFLPAGVVKVGTPAEILNKVKVIILKLDGSLKLKQNDKLIFRNGDEINAVTILSIRQDDQPVTSASDGVFGLKLDKLVPKNTILYYCPQ